jgi:hypothetical protein
MSSTARNSTFGLVSAAHAEPPIMKRLKKRIAFMFAFQEPSRTGIVRIVASQPAGGKRTARVQALASANLAADPKGADRKILVGPDRGKKRVPRTR